MANTTDVLEMNDDKGPGTRLPSLPRRIVQGISVFLRRALSPIVRVSNRCVTQLVVIVILIGIFWWNVAAMFVTQQQVHSSLDATFTELKRLRSENVYDTTWQQFRQSSLAKLASFVPKLEQEADVSDPASLSLLAVSNDYVPKLLNEESRFSDELEYNITRHLDVVRQSISQGTGTGSGVPPEFLSLLLVSLNAGLVLWVVLFVAKKLLVRAAR